MLWQLYTFGSRLLQKTGHNTVFLPQTGVAIERREPSPRNVLYVAASVSFRQVCYKNKKTQLTLNNKPVYQ